MLLRRTLTPKQCQMIDYQRDRHPAFASTSDGASSDDWSKKGFLDSAIDKIQPTRIKSFLEGLKDFRVETELDGKLLLGLLQRSIEDCEDKRGKPSIARSNKDLPLQHGQHTRLNSTNNLTFNNSQQLDGFAERTD